MIIVSQYKNEVWNFNNLGIIYVPRETQYEGNWSIKTQDQNGDIYELGNYGTKERAKEVLEEIINKYVEYTEGTSGIYELPKVYRMPMD